MSKRNKDRILRTHLDIIRIGIKCFWRALYEFYFYEENQDFLSKEGTILSFLESFFKYIKDTIEQFWKSEYEYYTNNKEFNEEIRRNKDFIFQDHCEMIRKGMEQLWRDLDPFFEEDNNF